MRRSDRLKKAIYEKIRDFLILEKEPEEINIVISYKESDARLRLNTDDLLKTVKDK